MKTILEMKYISVILFILVGFNLSAQYGSMNVLTREGKSILIPIDNIAYVYETEQGAELILDQYDSGLGEEEKRIQLVQTYDDVLAISCEFIRACEFIVRPSGERTAVAIPFTENIYETDGQAYALAKDGRKLKLLDPYIDIVTDLLCVAGTKPVNDIYLSNAQVQGTNIQLVMNTGTTFLLDLTASFNDEDTKVTSGFVNGNCEMVINMSDGSNVIIPLGNCATQITDTDDQTIDLFTITGNQLCISLEDDNEPVKCVDISSLNPDDQYVDILNFDGQQLCISLEGDNLAPICVDLTTLQVGGIDDFTLDCGTGQLLLDLNGAPDKVVDLTCLISDDQTIVSFYYDPNSQEICLEIEGDPNGIQCASITALNTDDQTADQFDLIGNTLWLSLEDDNVAPYKVDLSGLTGTDSDDQVVQVFSFSSITNLLSIKIEDDIGGTQTVDLSALINNGADTDDQCGTLSLSGTILTLDIDDCAVPSSVDISAVVNDNQQLNADINCTTGVLTLNLEDNPAGAQLVDLSCLVGGGGDDDQGLDLLSLDCNTNELSISLQDDGVDPYIVDLSCISGGSDYIWRIGSDTPNTYDVDADDDVKFKTTDAVLSSTVLDLGVLGKEVYYSFINGDEGQVLTLDANGMNPSWQDPGSIPICPNAPDDGQILVWDIVNAYYCPQDINTAANARNGLSVVNDGGIDYVELGGTLDKNTAIFGGGTRNMAFQNMNDFIVNGGNAWTLQTGGIGIVNADTEMWMQLPNTLSTPDGSIIQKQESAFGTVLYTPYGLPTTIGSDGDFLVYNDVTNQAEWMPSTNGLINFDITGESGTQTISTGDNINITGSNLISTAVTATDNLDVFIDGTGATLNQVISWDGSNAIWDDPITAYTFTIDGDDADTETISNGDNVTFTGLGVMNTNVEATDEIEFSINAGNNNEILTTVGGVVQWASPGSGADDWGNGTFAARADGALIGTIDESDQLRITGDGITATTLTDGGLTKTINVSIPAGPAGTILSSDGSVVSWAVGGGGGDGWGAAKWQINDNGGTDLDVLDGHVVKFLEAGVINVTNTFSGSTHNINMAITPGTNTQVLTTVGSAVVWADPSSGDDWGAGTFTMQGESVTMGTVSQGNNLKVISTTGTPLTTDFVNGATDKTIEIGFTGGAVGEILTKTGASTYDWQDFNGTEWTLGADAGLDQVMLDGYQVNFQSNDAVFTTAVAGIGGNPLKTIEFQFINGLSGQVLTLDGTGQNPSWQDPAGGTITASNGLTKLADDIKLGGTLSGSTTINQGGNDFYVQNGSVSGLFLDNSGSVTLKGLTNQEFAVVTGSTKMQYSTLDKLTVFSSSIRGQVDGGDRLILEDNWSRISSSVGASVNALGSQAYLVGPSGAKQVTANDVGIRLSGLPTSDPGISNYLWNDSGTIKISL